MLVNKNSAETKRHITGSTISSPMISKANSEKSETKVMLPPRTLSINELTPLVKAKRVSWLDLDWICLSGSEKNWLIRFIETLALLNARKNVIFRTKIAENTVLANISVAANNPINPTWDWKLKLLNPKISSKFEIDEDGDFDWIPVTAKLPKAPRANSASKSKKPIEICKIRVKTTFFWDGLSNSLKTDLISKSLILFNKFRRNYHLVFYSPQIIQQINQYYAAENKRHK